MATNRLWRTLSAFDSSTRMWVPVSSRNAQSQVIQRLSLTSWNIDGFSSRAVSRAKLILGHILEGPKSPDIIFLQEVTPNVCTSLLDDARVRAAFLATDAEDQTSFEKVPFATMTLLSRARFASDLDSPKEGVGIEGGGKFMLGRVSRVTLPSKYERDALCVDIIPPTAPGTVFRLINVHLDSLWDTLHYRAQQLEILANVLREPGCGGGIIAGDFNAISPEDDGLVNKAKLVDAWVALHGKADPDGATWGVGVERRDGLGWGRLDKVAMMGLKATEIEVLRPGLIEVPRPGEKPVEIPWSDHCGLRCTFTINAPMR
jgi:tyrosyl-DNA phosphodiesterase 2